MNEKYIVGLGNPGTEYKNNRHNIGFLILEHFTEKYKSKFILKNILDSNTVNVDEIFLMPPGGIL